MKYDLGSWSQEDALACLVRVLRGDVDCECYGFDLHVDSVAHLMVKNGVREQPRASEDDLRQNTRILFDAAWYLVQIGVLRLGRRSIFGVDRPQGVGYSLTAFGTEWIKSPDRETLILGDSLALTNRFKVLSQRLGPTFESRAVEAHRCFTAGAYIASCAMSGAAAEAVLLTLALAKSENPKVTLKDYHARNGRQVTRNFLVGKATGGVQGRFDAYLDLISYWRDSAAHGAPTSIDVSEARLSLIHLLNFANMAVDMWDDLTSNRPPA